VTRPCSPAKSNFEHSLSTGHGVVPIAMFTGKTFYFRAFHAARPNTVCGPFQSADGRGGSWGCTSIHSPPRCRLQVREPLSRTLPKMLIQICREFARCCDQIAIDPTPDQRSDPTRYGDFDLCRRKKSFPGIESLRSFSLCVPEFRVRACRFDLIWRLLRMESFVSCLV